MLGICFAHFEETCFLLMNGGAEENILLVVPKPAWGGNRLVGTEFTRPVIASRVDSRTT